MLSAKTVNQSRNKQKGTLKRKLLKEQIQTPPTERDRKQKRSEIVEFENKIVLK